LLSAGALPFGCALTFFIIPYIFVYRICFGFSLSHDSAVVIVSLSAGFFGINTDLVIYSVLCRNILDRKLKFSAGHLGSEVQSFKGSEVQRLSAITLTQWNQ